ncbi:transglycosylase domain-containing protein [bacterium]|nr:transglycosylase domain-containing protein [bacterium]
MLRKRSQRQKARAATQVAAPESPPPAARPPRGRRRWLRLAMAALLAYMVVFSVLLGLGLAYVMDILESLDPELARMETYRPKQVTRVLDRDGALVGEIFEEKRELVPFSDMCQYEAGQPRWYLIQALVATEDKNYFRHYGVDPEGILRAAWVNLKAGSIREGGSTLTQQLAKDMILTATRTWERKIREAFLALRITQRYTKEETLEIYLNQVEFGHDIHGIGAAAQFYFNKHVSELSLEECATLVGLLKAPTRYSPIINPKRSAERMRVVLARMREEGYLSERELARARDRTLRLAGRRGSVRRIVKMPYFLDYVSRDLAGSGMFGTRKSPGALSEQYKLTYDDIREQGFVVRTTLDPNLQEISENALRAGVRAIEQERRRHSWYWGDSEPPPWPTRLSDGAVLDAVIEASSEDTLTVRLSLDGSRVVVAASPEHPARRWMTEYGVLDKGFHVRVIAHASIPPLTREVRGDKAYTFTLMDEPHVQGAVVLLEWPRAGLRRWSAEPTTPKATSSAPRRPSASRARPSSPSSTPRPWRSGKSG